MPIHTDVIRITFHLKIIFFTSNFKQKVEYKKGFEQDLL